MINLQKTSGLPIEVMDDFKLKFNPPMQEFPMSFGRKFLEMIPVLLDKDTKAPAEVTYPVYRGLYLPEHEALIKANRITYDVTILLPVMLGPEFNKVLGHYHANIPGTPLAHPELYEVIWGSGIFFIQKMDPEYKKLIFVIAIEAKTGDKVIFPPGYGHIFINTGNTPMITANWSSVDEKALYEPVKEKHGMAYYVINGPANEPVYIENKNYPNHPLVRKISMISKIRSEFKFDPSEPMYLTAMKNPKLLEFLASPQKYESQLAELTN